MYGRTPFVFFAPAFALLGFVLLSPVVYAMWFSLFRIEYGAPTSFAGLRNFERLLDDSALIATFGRTAFHTGASVVLTIAVALALAVWINRLRGTVAFAVQTVVIVPWIISTVVATLLWSGVGSAILYKIVDIVVGLRPEPDQEREGLDITDHGERAYNY